VTSTGSMRQPRDMRPPLASAVPAAARGVLV
jgi:hypothetical protein